MRIREKNIISLTKNNFEDDAFYIRNEMNLDQNGVNSNNQETCGIITKDNYFNAELSVDMNIQSIARQIHKIL